MASMSRTVNITVPNNQTERNLRSECNIPLRVNNSGDKLHARTYMDDAWIRTQRQSRTHIHGASPSPLMHDLKPTRFGPNRFLSDHAQPRNPYDLRSTSSLQSNIIKRPYMVDPRFRRSTTSETSQNHKSTRYDSSLQKSPTSPRREATQEREAEIALNRVPSTSVGVQTMRYPTDEESSWTGNTEKRRITLKRSSSDICIRSNRGQERRKTLKRSSSIAKPLSKHETKGVKCIPERSHNANDGYEYMAPRETETATNPSQGQKHNRELEAVPPPAELNKPEGIPSPKEAPVNQSMLCDRCKNVPVETSAFNIFERIIRTLMGLFLLFAVGWLLYVSKDMIKEWWFPADRMWSTTRFVLRVLTLVNFIQECQCS